MHDAARSHVYATIDKAEHEDNKMRAHKPKALRKKYVLVLLPQVRQEYVRFQMSTYRSVALFYGDVPDVLPERLSSAERQPNVGLNGSKR